MKFLVPNYSCLQNPWLRGYRPQIPVLSALCPQQNVEPPTRTKFLGTPLHCTSCIASLQLDIRATWHQIAHSQHPTYPLQHLFSECAVHQYLWQYQEQQQDVPYTLLPVVQTLKYLITNLNTSVTNFTVIHTCEIWVFTAVNIMSLAWSIVSIFTVVLEKSPDLTANLITNLNTSVTNFTVIHACEIWGFTAVNIMSLAWSIVSIFTVFLEKSPDLTANLITNLNTSVTNFTVIHTCEISVF